jgi:hypothetical protein
MVKINPTQIKKVSGPALICVGSRPKGSEVISKEIIAMSGDLFCPWITKNLRKI